jgi:hypothetical protein
VRKQNGPQDESAGKRAARSVAQALGRDWPIPAHPSGISWGRWLARRHRPVCAPFASPKTPMSVTVFCHFGAEAHLLEIHGKERIQICTTDAQYVSCVSQAANCLCYCILLVFSVASPSLRTSLQALAPQRSLHSTHPLAVLVVKSLDEPVEMTCSR